jgi:gamma-glutamyltranspeptidase/glutathione hydrolase
MRFGLRLAYACSTLLLSIGLLSVVPNSSHASYMPEAVGTSGMVSAAHSLATQAGMDILKKGGNAFDAVVAVCATLGVVEPSRSSISGAGFMTLYDAKSKDVVSLQMTGAAPYAAKPSAFKSKRDQEVGYLSGVVPGNFGGWVYLLQKYGTMSLAEVLQTAIHYAEDGYPLDSYGFEVLSKVKASLEIFPTSAKVFLPSGDVPKEGEILKQKDLAATMKRLAAAEQNAIKAGKSRSDALMAAYDLFYKGELAKEMVAFYKENEGLFTAKDLADYQPVWTKPVQTSFKGYDVFSNNAPSRGGIQTVMILNILETFDLKKMGHNSAEYLHLLAEAIKLVNADVYKYVGDPKFVKIPLEGLLSKEYAAERRKLISMEKAIPFATAGNPAAFQKSAGFEIPVQQAVTVAALHNETGNASSYVDDTNTTHIDIYDKAGNAVACTPTIGTFGTKVVVGNTGMIFHNATRFGSFSPYKGDANFIDGGKTSLLNNSPLIALKNGKPVMVWGTPGGEGIGQLQFQVFLNVVEFGMGIQDAIEAVRMQLVAKPDFYKPEIISPRFESRLSAETRKSLEAKGHKVQVMKEEFEQDLGGMQGIVINQDTGVLRGGADPRRGGSSLGY